MASSFTSGLIYIYDPKSLSLSLSVYISLGRETSSSSSKRVVAPLLGVGGSSVTDEALVHKVGACASSQSALDSLERSVREEEWQAFSSLSSTTRQRNTSSPRTGESEYYSDSTSWPCWDISSGELAKFATLLYRMHETGPLKKPFRK